MSFPLSLLVLPAFPLGLQLGPAAEWSLLAYGILLIAGGILGYVLPEKPSKASLIAGSATGALAIAAFFLARSNARAGFALGLAVAALTGAMMFGRLRKTRKFMPSGMVTLLSAVVFLLLLTALLSGDTQGA